MRAATTHTFLIVSLVINNVLWIANANDLQTTPTPKLELRNGNGRNRSFHKGHRNAGAYHRRRAAAAAVTSTSTTYHNQQRTERATKSKKSKKSPKTISPMPSLAPTISHAPTLSSMPSHKPTSSPSSQPTSNPSGTPSAAPSLSTQPSYKPSPVPSHTPTSSPTSPPTSNPSSTPSAAPSLHPTPLPSASPSISPSQYPTQSVLPSYSPTLSYAPTLEVIAGTTFNARENTIQTGCVAPKGEEINYAASGVRRIAVEFLYSVTYIKDNTRTKVEQEGQIIRDLEIDFHSMVFNSYVDCPQLRLNIKSRARARALNEFVLDSGDHPIGASSLPKDSAVTDLACSNGNEGREAQGCILIDGGMTIIYPADSNTNNDLAVYDVLEFLSNSIRENELEPRDPHIAGVEYYGQRNSDLFNNSSGAIVSSAKNNDIRGGGDDEVSAFGGVVIGASIILLIGTLFAVRKRQTQKRFRKLNDGTLTSLRGGSDDGSYDLDGVDEFEFEPEYHNNKLVEIDERTLKRSTGTGNRFPLTLPIVEVGDDGDHSSASDNVRYYAGVSRTVGSIPSCSWDDEIEVDFSISKKWKFSHGDDASSRSYTVSNTVYM